MSRQADDAPETRVADPRARVLVRLVRVPPRRENLRVGKPDWQEETLMGLFDGLLGGIVGAGMVSVVNGVLEQHGGLQGVVNAFEKNGLGPTVQSWVSTGPNQTISPDDVHKVIGTDLLQQLAAKSGLSVQELSQRLAQVLPEAVDKLTPNGAIPKA